MTKRAVLFAILGAVTGGVLGAISVGALIEVTHASAHSSDDIVQRAALLWGVLGAIHGLA